MKVARVQCALCGVYFSKITKFHLDTHGVTLEEYREKYVATTPEAVSTALEKTFSNREVVEHAIHLIPPEELQDAVASSGLSVFSRKARNSAIAAALALQEIRSELVQRSAALAAKVQAKFMSEPWRFERREDGTPVSNSDLLEIFHAAMKDLKDATDAQMRFLNNVVQDNKVIAMRPGAQEHVAFTGEYDRVPQLRELSGHQREKLRLLMEKFVGLLQGQEVLPLPTLPDAVEEDSDGEEDGNDG